MNENAGLYFRTINELSLYILDFYGYKHHSDPDFTPSIEMLIENLEKLLRAEWHNLMPGDQEMIQSRIRKMVDNGEETPMQVMYFLINCSSFHFNTGGEYETYFYCLNLCRAIEKLEELKKWNES